MRWHRVAIAAFATGLVIGSPARADHAVCPTDPGFPFLDFDGDLCHGPGDSGDVTSDLTGSGSYSPPSGSLVCTGPAITVAYGAGPAPSWSFITGGVRRVILDCATRFRGAPDTIVSIEASDQVQLNEPMSAPGVSLLGGGGIAVNAPIRRAGTIDLKAGPFGMFVLAPGVRLRSGGTFDAFAFTDLLLGERAAVRAAAIDVTTGEGLFLADRVQLVSGSDLSLTGSGGIHLGDRVRLVSKGRMVFINSSPTPFTAFTGGAVTLRAGGMVLAATGAGPLGLAPGTRIRADAGASLTGTSVVLDGTAVRAPFLTVVAQSGDISMRDAVIQITRDDGVGPPPTVSFQTPPGATCDLAGTVIVNATPTFSGCTPILF